MLSQIVSAQILPSFGSSRSGTTGMQFLKLGPDAASNGAAGTVVGHVKDASAAFWNPSGICVSDSQKLRFQVGQSRYFANMNLSHAALIFQNKRHAAFGLSIMSLNSPEMDVTTEFMPMGTGEKFGVSNLLVGFSYAQYLLDNFKFGLTVKYANENIAGVVSHNGLFDFGFQYLVGLRDVSFGVAISNFGFNVRPNGEVTITTLNAERQIDEFNEIAVPATFKLGATGTVIKKDKHWLMASLQLNHPTDNKESFAIGANYSYKELLFLRTGYQFGVQGLYPSCGFGLKLQRYFGDIQLDYSYTTRNILGSLHQVTLGFSLN